MPELALGYSVGFLMSAILSGIFLYTWRRRRQSGSHLALSNNLKKVGFYWSEDRDSLLPWTETVEQEDLKSAFKNMALTCGLLVFFSWAGFLFILILMISYNHLAKSPLQRSLYKSTLVENANLSEQEIQTILNQLSN